MKSSASEILLLTTSALSQFRSFQLRFLNFMISYVFDNKNTKAQLRWIDFDGGGLNFRKKPRPSLRSVAYPKRMLGHGYEATREPQLLRRASWSCPCTPPSFWFNGWGLMDTRYSARRSGAWRSISAIHWSSDCGYPSQWTRYLRPLRVFWWSKIFSISYSSSESSYASPGHGGSQFGNNSGLFVIAGLRRRAWKVGWIL